MSITYYRVDLEHPGIAAARLPGASFDVVEVGVSAHYPGEIVFKIVEPAGKVGGQVRRPRSGRSSRGSRG